MTSSIAQKLNTDTETAPAKRDYGIAILRDKVFFVTDNAHLLALDRADGKLLWESTMPLDAHQPYGGTIAPLIVHDTVVAGVAGADHGIRGFVAAYKADT